MNSQESATKLEFCHLPKQQCIVYRFINFQALCKRESWNSPPPKTVGSSVQKVPGRELVNCDRGQSDDSDDPNVHNDLHFQHILYFEPFQTIFQQISKFQLFPDIQIFNR